MTAVLSASGIRAGFGSRAVLHGVDVEVRAHQVTGIFG